MDKKNNESINSNTKDLMNQSNSKKRIVNEFYINYMENLFENEFQNNNLNNQIHPKPINDSIFYNNFSSTINKQISLLNINNNNINISKTNKKDNLIKSSEREGIISKKQTKPIILKNNDNNNNNQIYKIKSKRQKSSKSKSIDKNEKKNVHVMETLADKKDKDNKYHGENDFNRLSQTDADLQDMDYEEAIIYDKRSYLRMYWASLVDTQIILGTFCTENYLNLMIIKLSFFVFTFQISFFLNAFFYTDEYISDAYHNEGVLDFITGLPKSVYSFVATLITTNLLKMLSNSQSELKKTIRTKSKYNNYIELINSKLSKLRKKLIVYFILVFLLESFFLYYVTAFCAVYRYSQKYWFFGCLESFAMDSVVALIICIFLSLFRYISIKKHIKCFYSLANFIGIFL